jgi:hypothetical protein
LQTQTSPSQEASTEPLVLLLLWRATLDSTEVIPQFAFQIQGFQHPRLTLLRVLQTFAIATTVFLWLALRVPVTILQFVMLATQDIIRMVPLVLLGLSMLRAVTRLQLPDF